MKVEGRVNKTEGYGRLCMIGFFFPFLAGDLESSPLILQQNITNWQENDLNRAGVLKVQMSFYNKSCLYM